MSAVNHTTIKSEIRKAEDALTRALDQFDPIDDKIENHGYVMGQCLFASRVLLEVYRQVRQLEREVLEEALSKDDSQLAKEFKRFMRETS